jgi:hypothetical protein
VHIVEEIEIEREAASEKKNDEFEVMLSMLMVVRIGLYSKSVTGVLLVMSYFILVSELKVRS